MGLWAFLSRKPPETLWSERIADLERRVRDIELDWDATFEKFSALYKRLHKRAKAALEASETDDQAPEAPRGPVVRNPMARKLLGLE